MHFYAVDTNSHLTTKPSNFDIKCNNNSESYDRDGFFGTNFRGGQNLLFTVGGFFNERVYSGADWLDLLICHLALGLLCSLLRDFVTLLSVQGK